MGQKKTIPHVSEAGGNDAKHLAAANHAAEQIAHGHYRLADWSQETLPDGGERISVTRYETDPNQTAEPHGL